MIKCRVYKKDNIFYCEDTNRNFNIKLVNDLDCYIEDLENENILLKGKIKDNIFVCDLKTIELSKIDFIEFKPSKSYCIMHKSDCFNCYKSGFSKDCKGNEI